MRPGSGADCRTQLETAIFRCADLARFDRPRVWDGISKEIEDLKSSYGMGAKGVLVHTLDEVMSAWPCPWPRWKVWPPSALSNPSCSLRGQSMSKQHLPGDVVGRDKVGGDKTTIGDINHSAVAIGDGAQAILTIIERALTDVEVADQAEAQAKRRLGEALLTYVHSLAEQPTRSKPDSPAKPLQSPSFLRLAGPRRCFLGGTRIASN